MKVETKDFPNHGQIPECEEHDFSFYPPKEVIVFVATLQGMEKRIQTLKVCRVCKLVRRERR